MICNGREIYFIDKFFFEKFFITQKKNFNIFDYNFVIRNFTYLGFLVQSVDSKEGYKYKSKLSFYYEY
jgi:hypothetical protein